VLLAGGLVWGAGPEGQVPDFKEVYELIRAHLPEVTEAELNRAAVQGLLTTFSSKVSLVGSEAGQSTGALVSRSNVFDGQIAYVRVSRVSEGLDKAIRAAWQELSQTNKLDGVVLDLRYARGDDFAAAAAAAEVFTRKEQPLLDWGKGMIRSSANSNAITVPLTVLVNRQTGGAAEVLAAVLQQTGAALVLGSRTAGAGMVSEEFPLKEGGRLRIATAPVHLGDGTAMSTEGLKPEIAVGVSPQDEQAYYADAFRDLSRTGLIANVSTNLATTNRVRRVPINEAELVRERKEGLGGDVEAPVRETSPDKPIVRDPVLARALDVLKGLAVIRKSRS
jgi:C-terminal processing protease CtpA/Prc